MSAKVEKHARELLLKEYHGMLATHSKKMPGFPFGSVVPYCLDAAGWPLLLISRIAQHTHNLQADPRCSLLIGERNAEDVQAAGRLTLLAEARQLDDAAAVEAAAVRYYRYFPQAKDFHRIHDFDFWVLEPRRWRFIGGFGAIHWLDSVSLDNPFAGEPETGMLAHMNHDHSAAISHFLSLAGIDGDAAEMVGIDAEGVHLRVGSRLHWLPFPTSCNTPLEVRQALVQLARSSKWPSREKRDG